MANKLKISSTGWTKDLIIKHFGLETVYELDTLSEWMDANGNLNDYDEFTLNDRLQALQSNVFDWNEEELKINFIGYIINLARFQSKQYRTYWEREISANINDIEVKVKTDFLLSKGIGEIIETPYFCIQEYKREKKFQGDPQGQMLAGMLIAQANNDNQKPVYGGYVQGRNWFFCVLEEKKYCISPALDATQKNELYQIVFILRKLKTIIDERLLVN